MFPCRTGSSVDVVPSGGVGPPAGGTAGPLLEGGGQGLYNPLAWDNMPSALREKFPHWKEGSLPGSKSHANSSAQGR